MILCQLCLCAINVVWKSDDAECVLKTILLLLVSLLPLGSTLFYAILHSLYNFIIVEICNKLIMLSYKFSFYTIYHIHAVV